MLKWFLLYYYAFNHFIFARAWERNHSRGVFRDVCYDELGCFYTGKPFYDPVKRPVSVAPEETVHTRFLLFTRNNASNAYHLLPNNTIEKSPFNCSLKTKFVIHGFMVTDLKTPLKMKKALLKRGNYNIIVVDHAKYSQYPYYQAVANARTIGARVALLITFLIEACQFRDARKFHLIGHSIGSHICGYAGKRLSNLQRISALDPAYLYFQGMPAEVRLDKKDARFVDVIHTNAADLKMMKFGAGLKDAIGDQDYYVNDGNTQPNCSVISKANLSSAYKNITELFSKFSCSHSRAWELYTESITSKICQFKAVRCDSYEDFKLGKCLTKNSVVSTMGFHSRQIKVLGSKKTFYLRTSGSPPFCLKDGNTPEPRTILDYVPVIKNIM